MAPTATAGLELGTGSYRESASKIGMPIHRATRGQPRDDAGIDGSLTRVGRMNRISSVRARVGLMRERIADAGNGIEDRDPLPLLVLGLADQAREQHGLAAGDSDRALDRRCEIVGVSDPALPAATLEISCSMSSTTLPLELARGSTRRMMPVFL